MRLCDSYFQAPLFRRSSRFGYRRWRRSGWLLVRLALDTPHKARDGCDPACRRSSTSRDSRTVCCVAASLSGSHATGILCSKYTLIPFITSRTSTWRLLPPRLAGGINGSTCALHRRLGHSDISICCGRNVRGSSPSTSVVPLSNQVTNFESQTIQRIQNVFGRTLRAKPTHHPLSSSKLPSLRRERLRY